MQLDGEAPNARTASGNIQKIIASDNRNIPAILGDNDIRTMIMVPLTAVEKREVKSIWDTKISIGTLRWDWLNTSGREWLHEEIAQVYLELVAAQHRRDACDDRFQNYRCKCLIFDTYFWSQILTHCKYDYNVSKRRSMKSNYKTMEDYDKLIFPMHINKTHWILTVVDCIQKTLEYFDSLSSVLAKLSVPVSLKERKQQRDRDISSVEGSEGPIEDMEYIVRYLDCEAKEFSSKIKLDWSEWRYVIHGQTSPQQDNGSDCGFFMIAGILHAMKNVPFTQCTPQDIKELRFRMVRELQLGHIILR